VHEVIEKVKRNKSTHEIQTLLSNANIDFEAFVNRALNDYLPKVFLSCPFTEELCLKKQCMECDSSKIPQKNAIPKNR
jgi:hypothetical protein